MVLDELGFVAVGLSREFFLSRLPVPGTLEVRVRTPTSVQEYFDTDYTYSEVRNSITFLGEPPRPLDVVEIEYRVLASADQAEPPEEAAPQE